MNPILYDLLIRGVLPLGIVMLVGFLLKQYFKKIKEIKFRHVLGVLFIVLGLFYIYTFISNIDKGTFEYEPNNLRLSGEFKESCSFNECVWKIDKDSVIYIPLGTKKTQIESLYIVYTSNKNLDLNIKIEDTEFLKKLSKTNINQEVNLFKDKKIKDLIPKTFVEEDKRLKIKKMFTGYKYYVVIKPSEDIIIHNIKKTAQIPIGIFDIIIIFIGFGALVLGVLQFTKKNVF